MNIMKRMGIGGLMIRDDWEMGNGEYGHGEDCNFSLSLPQKI